MLLVLTASLQGDWLVATGPAPPPPPLPPPPPPPPCPLPAGCTAAGKVMAICHGATGVFAVGFGDP